MPYTYLITGATSDVGPCAYRTSAGRCARRHRAGTGLRRSGKKLADLCARFPGQVRPFDVDLPTAPRWTPFVQVLAASAPAPTHFIHLPALPVCQRQVQGV